MMKSIRFRVIGTYLIIIILTIVLFEAGAYSLVRNYYMSNVEIMLRSELDICLDIYDEFYLQYDVRQDAAKIGERFKSYTNGQVQLLSPDGMVLYDSIGLYAKGELSSGTDSQLAAGNDIITRQETTALGERVMSVSSAIGAEAGSQGILKLTYSIERVFESLKRLTYIMILGGLFVVVLVSVVGLLLANTIVRPTRRMAYHVERIATGKLDEVVPKRRDDEFGKLADNLNVLTKELRTNKEMREQFIANVSHELRTPLTSIKGWIATLRDRRTVNEEEIDEGLEIMDRETDRLTGLVDELLDFSGFTLNKNTIKMSRFDIVEMIHYTCRQMKPRAERLGIHMSCSEEPNSFMFRGDSDRLKQVMINLLDNSLKYTEEGGRVDVAYTASDKDFIIKVKDTGIGISPSEQIYIFDKHYRGMNIRHRRMTGTGSGIGLALSKEIINLHGGEIYLESKLNGGTTVTIELKAT